jgi:hypothetical protein
VTCVAENRFPEFGSMLVTLIANKEQGLTPNTLFMNAQNAEINERSFCA